jgi:hypothetical protein
VLIAFLTTRVFAFRHQIPALAGLQARLAVNCVRCSNFAIPAQISQVRPLSVAVSTIKVSCGLVADRVRCVLAGSSSTICIRACGC